MFARVNTITELQNTKRAPSLQNRTPSREFNSTSKKETTDTHKSLLKISHARYLHQLQRFHDHSPSSTATISCGLSSLLRIRSIKAFADFKEIRSFSMRSPSNITNGNTVPQSPRTTHCHIVLPQFQSQTASDSITTTIPNTTLRNTHLWTAVHR